MGFVLKYCAACGIRIPEEDLVAGTAVDYANRTFCKDHVPDDARSVVRKTSAPAAARYISSGRSPSVGARSGSGSKKPKSGTSTAARTSTSGRSKSKSGVHVAVQIHEVGETEVRMDRSDRLARAGAMAHSGGTNTAKVVAIVGIVLMIVVGATIAAVVVSDGPSRRNRDNAEVRDAADNNAQIVKDLNANGTALGLRRWTDDVSRLRDKVKEATTGDAQLVSTRLRACYDESQGLILRGGSVGASKSDIDKVRKLAMTIADDLGFVLWDGVRKAYREHADNYRFVEAYELMTAIDTRQEAKLVPPTVFEDRDAFQSFFDEFSPALALASDEYAQYRELNADTKAFAAEIPRLKEAANDALRIEGNRYNLDRLAAFISTINEALTARPAAEPTAIPRADELAEPAGRVMAAYKAHLLDRAEREAGDPTGAFAAEVEAFLSSPAGVHFLGDEHRADLVALVGRMGANIDALAAAAEDIENGRADDSFVLLLRGYYKLQIAQYTIRLSDTRKRRLVALMLRAAEAANDLLERRHAAGADTSEYLMQLRLYGRCFNAAPFDVAAAQRAAERFAALTGGTVAEAEWVSLCTMAMDITRATQAEQTYGTVAWGYDALYLAWREMHTYFQQVGRERCTNAFMTGLRAVSTRVLTDLAVDAEMILSTRDRFSAKIWADRNTQVRGTFGNALGQQMFARLIERMDAAAVTIQRLAASAAEQAELASAPAPIEEDPIYRELVGRFRAALDEELRVRDDPRITNVWRLMLELKAAGEERGAGDITAELMGMWLEEFWLFVKARLDTALAADDWHEIHLLSGNYIKYLGWSDQYTTPAYVRSRAPDSAESLWLRSQHRFYSAPIEGVKALDLRVPGQQGAGGFERRDDGYLDITGPAFVQFGDVRATYTEVRYQLRLLEYNDRANVWMFVSADSTAVGSYAELLHTPAYALRFDSLGTTPAALVRDRSLVPYKHTVGTDQLIHHDWFLRHYEGPDGNMRAAPTYVMRKKDAATGRDGYPTLAGGLTDRYPNKGALVLFVPEGTRLLFGDLRQKP